MYSKFKLSVSWMLPTEFKCILFLVIKLWKILPIQCELPRVKMAIHPLLCGIQSHTPSSSRGLHQLFEIHWAGSWTHRALGTQWWKHHPAYTNNTCSFCTCIQKRRQRRKKENKTILQAYSLWTMGALPTNNPHPQLKMCLHHIQNHLLASLSITA